jgi:hypothetical protein
MLRGARKSSRIVMVVIGLTFGGLARSAPLMAADIAGECCADLEERVAALEATAVRKGNNRVTFTLSGWVVKSVNWWNDGDEKNVYVGDKEFTIASHFELLGRAAIAPGWSGGYAVSVELPGNAFGLFSNQFAPGDNAAIANVVAGVPGNFLPNLYRSYMWIKSDKWGALNWGLLSQATDNIALLTDLSDTIIESNAVVFEGPSFFLRPRGNKSERGLVPANWASFLFCNASNSGIGADCNGAPTQAIRYDSPTFGGFYLMTSYGEDDFWDVALKYDADWQNFKLSAGAGYTKMLDERYILGGGGLAGFKENTDLFQIGGSILHEPSGLFIYGLYQNENANFKPSDLNAGLNGAADETDVWYMKGGIKRAWTDIGWTVLFGEYGSYRDQFGDLAGTNVCAPGGAFNGIANMGTPGAPVGVAPICTTGLNSVFVSNSEVERVGFGIVQRIDAAVMHVFARWQHLDIDVNLLGFDEGNCSHGCNVRQDFDGLDIFQFGGVIFF